ncbi:hypothetical protein CPB97_004976, partial [Podila verticillata]
MIGNSGAGKSTLLTQLGATTFDSGARYLRGYTEEVHEEWVILNERRVLLIDVPGLFEPRENQTDANARKLTEALSRGYDYMLYFIMQAHNRGPKTKELLMMSTINDMYQDNVVHDNFRSLFQTMTVEVPDFSFDINISGVRLLPFNIEAVNQLGFANILAEDVLNHTHYMIRIVRAIQISHDLLKQFQAAVMEAVSRFSLKPGVLQAA